ncbi:hypothetical protein DFP92_1318 [Yoonia sediminilitoris]|uniref:Uncharacterized protein n=2 Tax=Yoonia sediminilitoris TaxID=1286148 RepID=A0A2T6K4C1_9RHOB|nr:hypothetical protein C8N45_1318 [Yoonia sediminilitoris]RCW89476.1 hypothetical protein DFP92_1318 [Yoonia sediminilitoris]
MGTAIYTLVIFPITAIWHVLVFQELYTELGYFKEKETVLAAAAGLVNILVQGFVLAALFLRTHFFGTGFSGGLKFAGLVGAFYFSVQVINFVVRKEISDVTIFVLLEAVYMAFQFGIYGLLMGVFVKPRHV